ncbi:MAG TPA: hypothetical protein VHE34_05760 [Puia sp.]|uniref:hypothetical protein n=1 Tax=Puia sp. TaxID=2045100 RepID=UPI002CDAA071|nr:hypothetical protein [Puia sp.]HVU94707.1 hypothetical protein [Puia sp.]
MFGKACLALVLLFVTIKDGGAVKVSWDTLQNIPFEEKYIQEVKGYMLFPKFPPALQRLDGQMVEVEGYVVPVDKDRNFIALSANPYAACYFCNKAGPASVMTVKFKSKGKRYFIDNYKTFRGRLRLNSTDIHQFYYVIEDAEDISQ